MSKPNKKRYRLSTVAAEARAKHPAIEIEADDGTVFTVDPPQLWPDEATDPDVGQRETMVALLGDQLDAYRAAGGTYSLLNLVITQYSADQGIDLGKSAASSTS